MGVLLPVYLSAIGSSVFVGLFFSLSALSSFLVLLLLGLRGQRIRVRNALVAQILLFSACLTVMTFSPIAALFLVAAAISITNWAPGGGSGTAGGAYNTSVNILLSENSEPSGRTLALSLSSVIGALSFAAGAYFLSTLNIPRSELVISPLTNGSLNLAKPSTVFAISAITQLLAAVLLLRVKNKSSVISDNAAPRGGPSGGPQDRSTAVAVFRQAFSLIAAEFSNGLGNGIFTQLVPLWLYVRFGISLGEVAEIFSVVGVLTAFIVLASPRLESRIGSINAIFAARSLSGALLVVTALAPSLVVALIPYFASLVFSRVSLPIQQSFVFAKVSRGEWTRGASMIATANVAGTVIGPTLGAFLLLNVNPGLPFFIAAPFILLSAWIYRRFLHQSH